MPRLYGYVLWNVQNVIQRINRSRVGLVGGTSTFDPKIVLETWLNVRKDREKNRDLVSSAGIYYLSCIITYFNQSSKDTKEVNFIVPILLSRCMYLLPLPKLYFVSDVTHTAFYVRVNIRRDKIDSLDHKAKTMFYWTNLDEKML